MKLIPHNIMEQYATLIISMSTDFLQGRITKEHYADTLSKCVKNMYDAELDTTELDKERQEQ